MVGGNDTLKYLEQPKYKSHTKLSAKGQVVISAQARKMYSESAQFEQVVFRDGTIVLTPIKNATKRDEFLRNVNNFYEKFGTIKETELLNVVPIEEELYD